MIIETVSKGAGGALTSGPVDLRVVAAMLLDRVGQLPPAYIMGKTVLRDAVMDDVGCSAARAETIVDRLETRGHVRFVQRTLGPLRWPPKWHICVEPRN